jgi:PilZ domain-containing protein
MASVQADAAQRSAEHRRNQRVKVDLLGRYMLEDRREFPCQVVDMSPGGMAVIAPRSGKPGERVVAYIDHVGRTRGRLYRSRRAPGRHDRTHRSKRILDDDFGLSAQARQAGRSADARKQNVNCARNYANRSSPTPPRPQIGSRAAGSPPRAGRTFPPSGKPGFIGRRCASC